MGSFLLVRYQIQSEYRVPLSYAGGALDNASDTKAVKAYWDTRFKRRSFSTEI